MKNKSGQEWTRADSIVEWLKNLSDDIVFIDHNDQECRFDATNWDDGDDTGNILDPGNRCCVFDFSNDPYNMDDYHLLMEDDFEKCEVKGSKMVFRFDGSMPDLVIEVRKRIDKPVRIPKFK